MCRQSARESDAYWQPEQLQVPLPWPELQELLEELRVLLYVQVYGGGNTAAGNNAVPMGLHGEFHWNAEKRILLRRFLLR